jgi:hypothetical protein
MTSLKRLYGDTLIVESLLVGARQLSRSARQMAEGRRSRGSPGCLSTAGVWCWGRGLGRENDTVRMVARTTHFNSGRARVTGLVGCGGFVGHFSRMAQVFLAFGLELPQLHNFLRLFSYAIRKASPRLTPYRLKDKKEAESLNSPYRLNNNGNNWKGNLFNVLVNRHRSVTSKSLSWWEKVVISLIVQHTPSQAAPVKHKRGIGVGYNLFW